MLGSGQEGILDFFKSGSSDRNVLPEKEAMRVLKETKEIRKRVTHVGRTDGNESMNEMTRAALSSLYHRGKPGNELFGLSLFGKWWESKELSYWYICQGAKARPNLRENSILYKDSETVAKAMAAMSVPVEGAFVPFPFIVREGDPNVHLKEHKYLKDTFTLQHYLLHPKSDFQMVEKYGDGEAIQVRWKSIPDEPDVFMHVTLEDLLTQANLKFKAPDNSEYSKRKQLLSKYLPAVYKELKAFRLDKFANDFTRSPYDLECFCCGDIDKLLILPAGRFDRNGDITRDIESVIRAIDKSNLSGMELWRTGSGIIKTDTTKVTWTDENGSVYLQMA